MYEKTLGGSQPYWYKDNDIEKVTGHMILNSLIYLQDLQMEYVDVYKGCG